MRFNALNVLHAYTHHVRHGKKHGIIRAHGRSLNCLCIFKHCRFIPIFVPMVEKQNGQQPHSPFLISMDSSLLHLIQNLEQFIKLPKSDYKIVTVNTSELYIINKSRFWVVYIISTIYIIIILLQNIHNIVITNYGWVTNKSVDLKQWPV